MKEDMYAMRIQLEQIKKMQEQEKLKFAREPVVIPDDIEIEQEINKEEEEKGFQKSKVNNFGFINLFGMFSLSISLIISMIGIRLLD